jgi:tRNA modification GTPase
VEQEGVRRARQRASDADLILWVHDADDALARGRASAFSGPVVNWLVRNKTDLMSSQQKNEYRNEFGSSNIVFYLSATTGEGFDTLFAQLTNYAASYFGAESPLISRQRHRKALDLTKSALDRALAEGARGKEVLVAEELRLAAQTLGRLTGRVDVENILEVIFRDFCIGK